MLSASRRPWRGRVWPRLQQALNVVEIAAASRSKYKNWQGRQDSNPRPAVLETAALTS